MLMSMFPGGQDQLQPLRIFRMLKLFRVLRRWESMATMLSTLSASTTDLFNYIGRERSAWSKSHVTCVAWHVCMYVMCVFLSYVCMDVMYFYMRCVSCLVV